ncbi:fumarylacetoacetate hydrolase family protein [Streptomyces sp. B21-108]|uniref:fumarylacetoacetate hydrolase family protein n=1 Tax=Streptomyces sp. B21-108 TaxID=3039419 RepID=UPI002FF03190
MSSKAGAGSPTPAACRSPSRTWSPTTPHRATAAGDLLTTGTVQGVAGFSGDPDMYLKPGDIVEAEVERLGVLRSPIVSWEQCHRAPVPQKVDSEVRGPGRPGRPRRGPVGRRHRVRVGAAPSPCSVTVRPSMTARQRSARNALMASSAT